MKVLHSLTATFLLCSFVYAAPISSESGFNGFVAGGVTTLSYKSNMVAGTKFDDEMSDKKIDNLNDKANSNSTVQPSLNFNAKYTFAEQKTEIFLGTQLEDVLTFESTAAIGARKEFDSLGVLGVSYLSSLSPTRVWKNPYATGVDRDSADMSSNGVSLNWEYILGSGFGAEFRMRKFDIKGGDKSPSDELNREGYLKQIILSYQWHLNQQHHITTFLRYSDYDLDGKAMQHTKTGLKVSYMYLSQTWSFITTVNASNSDYDNANPQFNGTTADAVAFGGSVTAMYANPFGLSEKLSFTTTIAGADSNSDIDFYDASVAILNVGLLYRF